MKFSTLTKEDLVDAYAQVQPSLDWGQAEAGETRHFLDFYYGINLSRALTSAIKSAGMFKILSTGRVQGPALKLLADREREIAAFIPVPFWQLPLVGSAKGESFDALHQEEKFWEKGKAESAFVKARGISQARVTAVDRAEFRQLPPHPFDLTTLQTEAYRVAGINPKATLQIAQDLYSSGFISYPRTSSQQLPEKLGFAKIVAALGKSAEYAALAKEVLRTKLLPHNGKKTDPAHPAIYPTGIVPKAMEGREGKVYDLIVKRFFSTFGEPAIRESVTMGLDVGGEPFVAKGTRTVRPNWHAWYAPFVKLEEIELPALAAGDVVAVKEVRFEEKATQPPKRFTPSSIIRELEKRNLGTKATRAEIISTLTDRNYIIGESIQVTELGLKLVDILEKNVPTILDEELTRHFEEDMDAIRARTRKPAQVLAEARDLLTKILHAFKERETLVGEQLRTTFSETKLALTKVGPCPRCKEGSIVLRKGKFGRFIACDRYPECKTTFSLPRVGGVEVTDKTCSTCQYPMVLMIKKAKRPQEVCINLDCPLKQPPEFKEGPCPRCATGRTILRRSVYGAFIACSAFPKCRYIAKASKPQAAAQVGSPSAEVVPGAGSATAVVSSAATAVVGAAKVKSKRKAAVKRRAPKSSKAQAI